MPSPKHMAQLETFAAPIRERMPQEAYLLEPEPEPAEELEPYKIPISVSNPHIARGCALIIMFAIAAVAGWLYETVFDLIQGHGIVLRAQFLLPWCPIYGIGYAVCDRLIGLGFSKERPKPARMALWFLACATIVTLTELGASYLLQYTTGAFPWDYSSYPLNFQGRIALPFSALFALIATLLLAYVSPAVHRHVDDDPAIMSGYALMVSILLVIEIALQYTGMADSMRDYIVHHPQIITKAHQMGTTVSVQSPVGCIMP